MLGGAAEKTCLDQSTSYLATDEDERRRDELPVFDKCVFQLIGERSAEEKKSARGSRGGEERAREGRCQANALRGKRREDEGSRGRAEEEKLTELCPRGGVKSKNSTKNNDSKTCQTAL